MTPLVRRYLKTSLCFFMLGLGLGVYMLFSKEVLGQPPHPQLITAHTHILLFGFVIGMIMGVATWMFPRPHQGRLFSPTLAEATYWLLTAGTLLRGACETNSAFMGAKLLHWLIVAGAGMQVVSALLFIVNIWTRIRPAGASDAKSVAHPQHRAATGDNTAR